MKYIIELKADGEVIKKECRDDYTPTLEELQRAVDGYIETVAVFAGDRGVVKLIVNKERIINWLRLNRRAIKLYGQYIFGDAVILLEDGEELVPLDEKEVEFIYYLLLR